MKKLIITAIIVIGLVVGLKVYYARAEEPTRIYAWSFSDKGTMEPLVLYDDWDKQESHLLWRYYPDTDEFEAPYLVEILQKCLADLEDYESAGWLQMKFDGFQKSIKEADENQIEIAQDWIHYAAKCKQKIKLRQDIKNVIEHLSGVRP